MTTDSPETPYFLTTKEVADLLRVKERKVYDLVAAEEIPHRRITGKLLFPSAEIAAWIEGESAQEEAAPAPALLVGSHDPLLEWAVRESGCGLAMLFDGSMDGLARFEAGAAGVAGIHIPEESGWNIGTLGARGLRRCVALAWAARSQGLILAEGVEAASLSDLRGRLVVARQEGAGSGALFRRLVAAEGLSPMDFSATPAPARTETDVAAAVAAGEADAALGLGAMARQFRLTFRPLVEERFDLLLDRRFYFTEPAQTLFAFAATAAFREKAAALGGYDIAALGEVRWLSP